MLRQILFLCFAFTISTNVSNRAYAQEFLAEGNCALIVASRQTVSETRVFIHENGFLENAIVYSSKNGWLAISIGSVPIENSKEVLDSLKAAGQVPPDSYCSTAKAYTGVVNWDATGDDTPSTSQNPSAFSTTSYPELLLFGGLGHNEFLGCLNCSEYDREAICNEYGMGSRYRSGGIFNKYSEFGSEYSSSSPWNSYTSSNSVPVLVDRMGNFYGYFTINAFRLDAFEQAGALASLHEKVEGDLEILRNFLCEDY